jgi:hypothetical protein
MTDRTDSSLSDAPQNGDHGTTATRSLPRRRVLAGMAAAGSVSLAGCLSGEPIVTAYGLANSLVFNDVEAAETFSVGGNRFTVSVYLTAAAFERLGVKELEVLTQRTRPYSAADADTPPGPFKTGMNIPVEVPVGEPATISALNEHGTTVESIRVTNDATAFLTWLGAKPRPQQLLINQIDMPAKILTRSFEKRETQFSTNAEMHGKIKNTARDGELSYLAAEAVFTDSSGNVVDRSVESIGLSAREVWDVVVPYLGDASDAASGKLTITESHAGRSPIPPANITVIEDSLEEPDEELEPPKVVGELRNTGTAELSFLEASAKFYAENGNVLGENSATVTGLPAGKSWSFEVPFYAHSTERAERIAEYELSLLA